MMELDPLYTKDSLLLPLLELNNSDVQWTLCLNTPLTFLFFNIIEEYKCSNKKREYRYVANAIEVLELMNRRFCRIPLEGFPEPQEIFDVHCLLSHRTKRVRKAMISYLITAMQIIYMEHRLPGQKHLIDFHKGKIEELVDPLQLKDVLESSESFWFQYSYEITPKLRVKNPFNSGYYLEYDYLMEILQFFWPSLIITVPPPSF